MVEKGDVTFQPKLVDVAVDWVSTQMGIWIAKLFNCCYNRRADTLRNTSLNFSDCLAKSVAHIRENCSVILRPKSRASRLIKILVKNCVYRDAGEKECD